jgi:small conductance mechanosensitive channel
MNKEEHTSSREMMGKFAQSILIFILAGAIAYLAYFSSHFMHIIPTFLVDPIYAIILLAGGFLITRVINAIISKTIDPTLGRTRGRGAKNFFQLIIAILVLVSIFAIFGFNITSWLIGAGFIGIVLGLAAQQVLGNIFAGVSLLASRPFEIGDRITLVTTSYGMTGSSYSHENMPNGFSGVVQDVGIFYTKLTLDDGIPVVLPNSAVIASLVMNHTRVQLRTVRIRMDLDKKIRFDDFKSQISSLLQSKPNDLIEPSSVHVEMVDVGQTTYQVAIWAWSKSRLEEPVKTVLIQYALEVQARLSGP